MRDDFFARLRTHEVEKRWAFSAVQLQGGLNCGNTEKAAKNAWKQNLAQFHGICFGEQRFLQQFRISRGIEKSFSWEALSKVEAETVPSSCRNFWSSFIWLNEWKSIWRQKYFRCRNCEVIDYSPMLVDENGHYLGYNPKNNLAFIDNANHLTRFAKERVQPLFDRLAENFGNTAAIANVTLS